MYLYESHMGGIYTNPFELAPYQLYCEECHDSDTQIGWFKSAVEALTFMANDIIVSVNDEWGGRYRLADVMEAISCFKDCPTFEEARQIVLKNRMSHEKNF